MPRRPAKAEAVADQIAQTLVGQPPGTWLPSWADLARTYAVSNDTVANARDILVERGLIELLPNRGARTPATIRLTRNEADQAKTHDGERGFGPAMRAAGFEPWDELLSVEDVEADVQVATQLGIPVGTSVLRRARVHGIVQDEAQVPVMVSWTWISPAMTEQLPILREPSTGGGGMTSRFGELGLTLRWEVVVTAIAAGSDAGRLGLPSGSPVLDAWRRCFDQSGRVLEVTRRIINPRDYSIVFTFGE